MAHNKAMKSSETRSRVRRALMLGVLSSSLLCAFIPSALADKLSCLPPQRLSENPTPAPANKKIGVTVAYLKVPFYANFQDRPRGRRQTVRLHLRPCRRQQRRRRNRTRQPSELHRAEEGPRPSHALRRRHHPRHQARQRRENSDHRSQQQGGLREKRGERAHLRRRGRRRVRPAAGQAS
jgi:hypothetical protein